MALITTVTRLPPEARLQRGDAIPAVAAITPSPLADVAIGLPPTPDRMRALSRRFARHSLDASASMSGSRSDGLEPTDAARGERLPDESQHDDPPRRPMP